ncbi:AAA family ATPase [Chitinophaga ginsengisoli]|uniref:AAA ATPase-like protein n=1 Tax=Chitinophaga ginsengisoli TaxID=363837 RepID=A0A2P8G2Y8_9BACT|nr:ATP-binding protein [Chitinophaga ginsengisoli]PSL28343.1 AAA ATPase-like protein [Chitinophaga ginsengisoli]
MITKIEVNGFKSLKSFDLKLKQGLNILVGPNGAGKTNIIIFFEFLSNIARQQVGTAISNVGGAGSIFQKIGRDDYADEIVSKIYGAFQIDSRKFIVYEYQFTIKISFEKDNVYYSNQDLKLRTATKFWDDPDSSNYQKEWDLDILYKTTDESKVLIEVAKYNKKKFNSRFVGDDNSDMIKDFLKRQNPMYYSIVKCLVPINDFLHKIFTDLVGGETFNVVPSKVRELEDSATPPGIKKDGSGLATTLYAMKKSKTKQNERVPRFWFYYEENEREYSPSTLDKIVKFLRAANSTIKSLDVDNDPFNNKLIVKITISTGNYEAVLPLSSMSDGTIKWLTLITAILTSKTIFSIEEPENFLHPWMQAEIAKIMRNHLSEKASQSFVLMTTHSESLLNHSNPEEIIIVDLNDGRTKGQRISNLSIIRDEIANSGCGLGHFYFSNALSNE